MGSPLTPRKAVIGQGDSMGFNKEIQRRTGTLPFKDGGKDVIKYLPILCCPCCRVKLDKIAMKGLDRAFKCPACSWKSGTFRMGIVVRQGDLDKMRLKEKEKGKG